MCVNRDHRIMFETLFLKIKSRREFMNLATILITSKEKLPSFQERSELPLGSDAHSSGIKWS